MRQLELIPRSLCVCFASNVHNYSKEMSLSGEWLDVFINYYYMMDSKFPFIVFAAVSQSWCPRHYGGNCFAK